MNLYLIVQSVNNDWDTYDSAVVAAVDEEQARNTHPSGDYEKDWEDTNATWAYSPEQVSVRYLGPAMEGSEAGVICASFNAG